MRPARLAILFRLMAVLISAVLPAFGVSGPATAAQPSGRSPAQGGSRHAALQAALGWAVTSLGSPGALAGVLEDGRSTALSAGVADVATGRRTDPDMHFRIGSITKMFVATVVLQLVGERRLQLSDTVEQWLPKVVNGNGNQGSRITVEMLLNHTSGLYNYTDEKFMKQVLDHPHRTYKPIELVGYALAHPPYFPPGTSYAYSNTNYILLGMIIERVTRRAYAAEIRDRILQPLGLRDTFVPEVSDVLPPPFMHGYSMTPQGKTDVTEFNPSWAGSAAGMISTVGDLDRFEAALLGGTLLQSGLLNTMLTPTPLLDIKTGVGRYRYGLGIAITTLSCGVEVYGHIGEVPGSISNLYGTRGGSHVLASNLNGGWLLDAPFAEVTNNIEFCPDTTLTGTHSGRLTVTRPTVLAPGAQVGGPIVITGQNGLLAAGATIAGPIRASGGRGMELCDTTVAGATTVSGMNGPITVDGPVSACPPSVLQGPVVLSGNTGWIGINGARIDGSLRVTGNTTIQKTTSAPSETAIQANSINGSLVCAGNTPPPSNNGQPNTVRGAHVGQCAAL
ncbi:serine hydrolase [Amycolatopsis cynarae]|uniref:Serine hydrolase n=1 Tax=Amycolatopsis cynarae TaxID=2995223 RepID=A0ABY7BB25_9PSEU|nr:serine hydrolase domain-containing protein [Amycolatopsis sp. HUAS 11-8]WAL67898.1 serine hydrolase [Amycolatopsis sp. HUAS 11-8]